jgi:hypothetical protein
VGRVDVSILAHFAYRRRDDQFHLSDGHSLDGRVADTRRATSLKLSSHGFTIRTWFRDESFRWSDVKEFRLITYRYLGFVPIRRSVGFRFSETYKRNVLRRIAGAIVSFDRILPDNFGMKAQQLVGLLESIRLQALANPANRYAISSDPIVPE